MNCNDRYQDGPPNRDDTGWKVTIPVHKIINWYRDWRIRKNQLDVEHICEYDDVVRDYIQDQ